MEIPFQDIELWINHGILTSTRHLYLGSKDNTGDNEDKGIEQFTAENFIKGLILLEALDAHGTTFVTMNSIGGDWNHGMAIYDHIKSSKNQILIHACGNVMSIASVIFQAASYRSMSKNSSMLLHYGTDGFYGHSKDFERHAEESKRVNKIMEDIYLEKIQEKNPKFNSKDLKKLLEFDKFLTAEEAVELGLADGVH